MDKQEMAAGIAAAALGDAGGLKELLIQTRELPWRAKSLAGLHEKMLWRDEASGASISLNRFDKGAGIPQAHSHASNQFMFCLEGRYQYASSGLVLTPGAFYCNPKGCVHGPTLALEDSVLLEIYDGPHYPQVPDWYTDAADAR